MATFRQDSFAGGMLSPSLEGRTDFDKRLTGARVIRNFFITPYGTLRRRPGVRFVRNIYGGNAPLSSATPAGQDNAVRLVTFRGRGNTDTLLIFAHNRVYAAPNGDLSSGAVKLVTPGAAPWRGRDLNPNAAIGAPGIKWSQVGNRLLVTHPSYEPQYIVEPETPGGEWTRVRGDTLVDAPDLSTFTAEYVAAED